MLKRDPVFFVNAVPLLLVVSDRILSIKTVNDFWFPMVQFDSPMKIFSHLTQRESLAANRPGSPRTHIFFVLFWVIKPLSWPRLQLLLQHK